MLIIELGKTGKTQKQNDVYYSERRKQNIFLIFINPKIFEDKNMIIFKITKPPFQYQRNQPVKATQKQATPFDLPYNKRKADLNTLTLI